MKWIGATLMSLMCVSTLSASGPIDSVSITYFGRESPPGVGSWSPPMLWPSPRKDAGMVTSFFDPSTFFLFGGLGLDITQNVWPLADLWSYTVSGSWKFVSGSNRGTAVNVVELPYAHPGGRFDSQLASGPGKLYLYGGFGNDATGEHFVQLADLWSYDTADKTWTFHGAHQTETAVYPGARSKHGLAYAAGFLYLFGGAVDATSNASVNSNQLWKIDTQSLSDTWTLIKGSSNPNDPGVLGTLRMPDTANVPSARTSASFVAFQSRFLFVYGGTSNQQLADLWMFDTIIGYWAWMGGGGSNGLSVTGMATAFQRFAPSNYPSARSGAALCVDSGYLFLFGGMGTTTSQNDVWLFDVSANQWAWVSGNPNPSNAEAILDYSFAYPSVGVPSETQNFTHVNHPTCASLTLDTSSPRGDSNTFIFGGDGVVGSLMDLWGVRTLGCVPGEYLDTTSGNCRVCQPCNSGSYISAQCSGTYQGSNVRGDQQCTVCACEVGYVLNPASCPGNTFGSGECKQGPVQYSVRYNGRFLFLPDGPALFSYSGCSITLDISNAGGKLLKLILYDGGFSQYTITLDGNSLFQLLQPASVVLDRADPITYNLFEIPDNLAHTVVVYKKTESSSFFNPAWFYGFSLGNDPTKLTSCNATSCLAKGAREPGKLALEFWGDSITCGYGAVGVDPTNFSEDSEAEYATYATQTAKRFGICNLHTECWSGIGLVQNTFDSFPSVVSFPNIVNLTAPWLPYNYYYLTPPTLVGAPMFNPGNQWNFASWQPDALVINLGTNDFGLTAFAPSQTVFESRYREFVHFVRNVYPRNTLLLLACGPMIDAYAITGLHENSCCAYVQNVVNTLQQVDHDMYVHFLNLTGIVTSHGMLGSGAHPNIYGHKLMADRTVAKLTQLLGWITVDDGGDGSAISGGAAQASPVIISTSTALFLCAAAMLSLAAVSL